MAIEQVATGFALLAPVYGLLFQIQSRLGRFETSIKTLQRRIDEAEQDLNELPIQ